jgi:hypothetical protein
MFSLPQPSNELVHGLPVLRMSEDAELVRALITVLYPIPSEIPVAYDRVLVLLAASQKYDMPAVQFCIRTKVSYRKLTAQTGDEAFRAFAIASRNGLARNEHCCTPHPRLLHDLRKSQKQTAPFEGWALRDLASFRKDRRDEIISCFESFLDAHKGPSDIWIGCPSVQASGKNQEPILPHGWRNFSGDRSLN